MKLGKFLAMLSFSLLLTACAADGRFQVTVITQGQHHLRGTTSGDLIMLGGETALDPGAVLDGSATLLAGQFDLEGVVSGDMSAFNGLLNLGPDALIRGDLNLGGGDWTGLDRAAVLGKVTTSSSLSLPQAPGPRSGTRAGTLLRWLVSGAVLGFAGLALERYLPRHVSRVGEAAFKHLPASLAMGLLAGIVSLTLLVLLAYTIVLIPVALLGGALLLLAGIYGWLSLGISLGKMAWDRWNLPSGPRLRTFTAILALLVALQALGSIPHLGGLLGILAASLGLGAVYLTRFGQRRFVPDDSL